MGEGDRIRWDERYLRTGPADTDGPPAVFADVVEEFPTSGQALELACGQGAFAVWLARRGLRVHAVDISPVAIGQARELARRNAVACRFEVADLDVGLPAGPPADLVVCHRFRDRRLDRAITARLAPGGVLAITALSEVGAGPGSFRVAAGELPAAFADLAVIGAGEGGGQAWLVARNPA